MMGLAAFNRQAANRALPARVAAIVIL